jgi:hypothetical protein
LIRLTRIRRVVQRYATQDSGFEAQAEIVRGRALYLLKRPDEAGAALDAAFAILRNLEA